MAELAGAAPALPYEDRLQRLTARGFALWDVCAQATRMGSLDSSIRNESVKPNAIDRFLMSHSRVRLIGFNGAKAEQLFRRFVASQLGPLEQAIARVTLPSTSPAHASMRFEQKLEAWRAGLSERPRGARPDAPGQGIRRSGPRALARRDEDGD